MNNVDADVDDDDDDMISVFSSYGTRTRRIITTEQINK